MRESSCRPEISRSTSATVRRVSDAWSALLHDFPALRDLAATMRIARNGRVAESGELLASGDELALLPPVGGG